MAKSISARSGGSWRTIVTPFGYASGAWRTAKIVYRNRAGVNERVWPNTTLMTASSRMSDSGSSPPYPSFFTVPLTDAISGYPWYVTYYYDWDWTDVTVYGAFGEGYWNYIDWAGRGTLYRVNTVTFTAFNGSYTRWRINGDDLDLAYWAGSGGDFVTFV
jgi:hypothetical protein